MAVDTLELSGWRFLHNMIVVLAANGHGLRFLLVLIVVTATFGPKITLFLLSLAVQMTSAIFSHFATNAIFANAQVLNSEFDSMPLRGAI